MAAIERRLCIAGVALFLFGLGLGFFVPAFADKHGVLNAHLTALGSGTFLIAIGLLWRSLSAAPSWSGIVAHVLWISFYILEAGLTLDATNPVAQTNSSPTTAHSIAGLLNAIGAIPMFLAVAAVLYILMKSRVRNS